MAKTTLGVIVGNRGFFPDHLAQTGREQILKLLEQQGFQTVCLTPEQTPFGSVETYEDAKKCADLFRANCDRIDGVLVTLPNFGDEKGVADALKLSGLDVPVLVHAWPDEPGSMKMGQRRDSFCGKLSVANNLRQYGIPFTLTESHTVAPASDGFKQDLERFGAVCRIVRGLRNCRVGAIGARTGPFNTCRFSEKLLELSGISVQVVDLSEVFGKANKLSDHDEAVVAKLKAISDYVSTEGVPKHALLRMAKFGVIVDRWIAENDLVGTAIQCWTSLEEFFGITPCTLMSMMSNALLPSACEVDIMGLIGMLALQWASQRPAALVDWNNNYGTDPDKAVIFHCSNLPLDMFESAKMDYQEIIAGAVGKDNTYGTVVGRLKAGPISFCRVSTDDATGTIAAYCGRGDLTDDPLETFGGYGVVHIPRLQDLLKYACKMGFEHHVAVTRGVVDAAVAEALDTYMGWDVYHHEG